MNELLQRAEFSNTGAHIGLVAPGVNILSCLPMKRAHPHREESKYAVWNGTSMASPHVAGAAALVAARHPDLDGQQIRERILDTARRGPEMGERFRTNEYGRGLLDLSRALA